jgi:DNA polymerase-3 subunit gamma/tau
MFEGQPAAEPADKRALYLRWRPRRFEDVVGQQHVTRTLRNAVRLGRPSHAYLFTGPRGTGKTTVARILYRAVNCEQAPDGDPCNTCPLCRAALEGRALDLVEIDAASTGGIADIRDLREKVGYRPNDGRYRLYIIDEAHEMSTPAWDALLKTLEEPPPHALFVLATTEAHKVPATIVSRCQRFDFRRIPYQETKDHLAFVAGAEGLRIEAAVFERLALVARGGLRDALSLLDQLSAFAVGEIDMSVARAALSLPSIEAVRGVIDGMTRRDPGTVMAVLSDAAEGGADLRLFADELVMHLRALLLLRTGADARLTDELPVDEVAWLRERVPAWSIGTLMQLVQTLSDALARTRDAQQFQVQTEVALLTACDVESRAPLQAQSVPLDADELVPVEGLPARLDEPQAPLPRRDVTLKERWPDVIEHVKSRNPILASLLGSALPIALEESVLVVAFGSDFNRKSAESRTHRQLIETAFERVYGTAYRLRGTVGSDASAAPSLLEDPVINFAQRTFGGEPKRMTTD